ncbi:hypothetical protein ACFLVS_01965 [Chloroflexota bacterium]
MSIKLIAMISISLVCLLGGSCAPARGFDGSLKSIVKPYRFSMVGWGFRTIPCEVKRLVFDRHEKVEDKVHAVTEYFSLVEQIKTLNSTIKAINFGDEHGDLASLQAELDELESQRTALEDKVVRIIVEEIKETLAQQGIINPFDKYIRLKFNFLPIGFKLEQPPHILVVSPRDRIESRREIVLQQSISLEEMEAIETEVDELGVSSLVVELGGFAGTYPSFVTDDASLRFVLDTATEEWLHKYLAFTPLGFRYLLDLTGISRDYEIATMNETVASMVSKEIGSIVYGRYYPGNGDGDSKEQPADSKFDFNHDMREIRRTVDEYLARGEIEQAEEFMGQKRQYLASMGYHIRKLNQAYFAFHGTYADSPTSISPIGVELKQLRSQSTTLKDFLDTVAVMTNRQDLRASVE